MISNTLKLNVANFDYYLLRISPSTALEQIASKLVTLREFDSTSKYLVIESDQAVDFALFSAQLKQIDQLAANFGLQVKFVLANEFINVATIADKPVIDLPATLKSKPIYNQTLVVEEPVRSGIQIENDGDVIVSGLVSNNAEIIATGNIHVYGDCRGRVLAGSRGNKNARIFVARFNAEIISIAGVYRVIEDLLPANLHNRGVQIFLDDKDRLNIMPLGL